MLYCVCELCQHWLRYWLAAWMTPSLYLNQCWIIVNWIYWNNFQSSFNQNAQVFMEENVFENVIFTKSMTNCFRVDELTKFRKWDNLFQAYNSLRPGDIHASLNCVIIVSDNGLSPVRHQSISWTNADLLLIGSLGANFSEIWIKLQTFSLKKNCKCPQNSGQFASASMG